MILYSKQTDLIYDTNIHSSTPGDCIEISNDEKQLHMGNITLPEGKRRKPHCYPFAIEDIPAPSDEKLAQQAQLEMISELNWCDLQIKLHESRDRRSVATIEDVYSHSRACRDHVQNVDGTLAIVGDKPERP